MEAAKPKVVAATPGWGGWAGDGVKPQEMWVFKLEQNPTPIPQILNPHPNPYTWNTKPSLNPDPCTWNRARKRVEVSFKKTQQDKLRIKMSGDVAPELRKDKVPKLNPKLNPSLDPYLYTKRWIYETHSRRTKSNPKTQNPEAENILNVIKGVKSYILCIQNKTTIDVQRWNPKQ